MLPEFSCTVWYSHESFGFGNDGLYSFVRIFLYWKKRQPYKRVALLAPKFFQCKRVLCSCGSTIVRCGVGCKDIHLCSIAGRVLKRNSWDWRSVLVQCCLDTSAHQQQTWGCDGAELTLSPLSPGRNKIFYIGHGRKDAEALRKPPKAGDVSLSCFWLEKPWVCSCASQGKEGCKQSWQLPGTSLLSFSFLQERLVVSH